MQLLFVLRAFFTLSFMRNLKGVDEYAVYISYSGSYIVSTHCDRSSGAFIRHWCWAHNAVLYIGDAWNSGCYSDICTH